VVHEHRAPRRCVARSRLPESLPEEPTLSWLTAALRSSVGQKFVMGLTGLFLCSFLLIHLAGNLLMWAGADAYNHYAHTLHANPVLLIGAELFLYAAFAAHIYLAFVTTRENWAARNGRYAMKQSKIEHTVNPGGCNPSNTMFVTGTLILGFLILHLMDFKFEIGWQSIEDAEPFDKAVAILSDGFRFFCYSAGTVAVGIHVYHGFGSAFQSLGLRHPKYTPCIEWFGRAFAVFIAVGFFAIGLWLWAGQPPIVPDTTLLPD
jgi:succinate dehydrogenase / fumarate reductase cytochrome b subunit